MIKHIWLHMSATDLNTEVHQLREEGRDLTSLEDEIAALRTADFDLPETQARFQRLMDQGQTLPLKAEAALEPDDLSAIQALRPKNRPKLGPVPTDLADRIHGAWLGRACGCLLGKPLEGYRSRFVDPILAASDNLPLHRYLHSQDAGGGKWDEMFGTNHWCHGMLIDRIDGMPEDDDMNYTVTALAITARSGRDFTSDDVANFWLEFIPVLRTCTAERVAYRNLLQGMSPPESAIFRNPYREWIGAQIRADFWGYINPGNPEMAAEMAWRDARVSHIKNGIYGEMWAAACIAAAFTTTDMPAIIEAGLGEIPENCRLAKDLRRTLAWRHQGMPYDESIRQVRALYDEDDWHPWTHTITNAVIVAIGLLWGEGDYGKTICRAVQPLYDTDCNGATAGSIFGAAHGVRAIGPEWADPIKDTLSTGVKDYERVRLSDLAAKTLNYVAYPEANA